MGLRSRLSLGRGVGVPEVLRATYSTGPRMRATVLGCWSSMGSVRKVWGSVRVMVSPDFQRRWRAEKVPGLRLAGSGLPLMVMVGLRVHEGMRKLSVRSVGLAGL